MGSNRVDLREEIRELIRERYGSVPKLARTLDMPAQTIYSSLKKSLVGSSLLTVMPIINALELDPMQLLNGRLEKRLVQGHDYVMVPLFERISAEQGAICTSEAASFPVIQTWIRQYPDAFLLRIPDECMSRILPKGCYALVQPTQEIEEPNAPYVLCIGKGDALVRRVEPLENGYRLNPDSVDPTFRPRIIDFADAECPDIQIIGKVVWYTLPLDWSFSQV